MVWYRAYPRRTFRHPEELGHPDNGLRIANKTGEVGR